MSWACSWPHQLLFVTQCDIKRFGMKLGEDKYCNQQQIVESMPTGTTSTTWLETGKHCTNVSHVYFRMACKALYTNLLTIRLTDNELRKQILNLNSSHHEATARTIHHRQQWFFGESIPIIGQKNPISPHRDSGRFDRKTHFWYWYISSCNNDNIKLIMII